MIRGATCVEADDKDHGIQQVGEQMKGVAHNRDRLGLDPQVHLDHEQDQDGTHRDPAGQKSVLDTDLLVIRLLKVPDEEADQFVVEVL